MRNPVTAREAACYAWNGYGWRELERSAQSLVLVPRSRRRPMHDAKECRDRALRCIRLAKGLPEGEERNSYADLARSWRRLSRGIEKSEAALDAWRRPKENPNSTRLAPP
jgi:hypothetical protein